MISRRHFLASVGAATLTSGCTSLERGTSRSPNIVIVFPDQMRAHAQGFMGLDPVKTPRLDAFAAQSHVFTEAISGYPVCSPFRAIMMSGMWPLGNGVHTNTHSGDNRTGCELNTDAVCWSDVLHAKGYDQFYIGKWHLDAPHPPWIPTGNNRGEKKWNEWCPPDRRHGFNRWYAYGTYDDHLRPMYWDTDAPRDGFKFVSQWGPEHEADKAVAFIKNENGTQRNASKPFTLVVSMNPPHTGYEAVPKKYYDLYKSYDFEQLATRKNIPPHGTPMGDYFRKYAPYYFAAVTGIDEQFGRILDALREQNLEEDTLVVFFSDHGCCLGANGLIAKNNPYEESLRIPMMFRWPGKIAPKRDSALIEAIDLAPTFLGLLDQKIPATMQGRDLSDYMIGHWRPERPAQEQLYLYMGVVSGHDRVPSTPIGEPIHVVLPKTCYGLRGVRTERLTCVFGYAAPGERLTITLFDRAKDPFELENRATLDPQTIARCRAILKHRLQRIHDPFAEVL